MEQGTRTILSAAMGGALAGVVVWFVMRPIVKAQIEQAITEELHRQIPQQLTEQLDARLASYGITPTTMQSLARAVDLFGRIAPSAPTTATAPRATA